MFLCTVYICTVYTDINRAVNEASVYGRHLYSDQTTWQL